MAQIGDDCYFFCTSTCAKGSSCPFRHVDTAKVVKIVCQHWQMGQCSRPMCKYRHSTFEIPVTAKSLVPCYWESQASGCTRPNCAYKHVKPRPGAPQSKEVGNGSESEASKLPPPDTAVKLVAPEFVAPQVKPVVIQAADSEDSNPSPLKRPVGEFVPEGNLAKIPVSGALKDISSVNKGNQGDAPKTEIGEKKATDERLEEGEKAKEGTGVMEAEEMSEKKPAAPKKKVVVKKKVKKVLKSAAGTKEGTVDAGTTPKKKKIVKKVKAKPTTGTPTAKTGTGGKKVVKKAVPKSAPVKTAVDGGEGSRQSVKDRLGLSAPVRATGSLASKPLKKRESPSGSDSDDSLENVTVKSVEEILREKALASMLKKQAPQKKETLTRRGPQKSNVIKLNRSRAPQTSRPSQPPRPVRPLQPLRPPVAGRLGKAGKFTARGRVNPRLELHRDTGSTGSSEEEDEEEELRRGGVEEESSSSESESSSGSEDDSEDSSESEAEVRRVIVENSEEEQAARQRAKASLLSRQRQQERKAGAERIFHQTAAGRVVKKKGKEGSRLLQGALGAALGKKLPKTGTTRTIKADYDSDDIFSRVKKPLSIRDRLGKPIQEDKPSGILERAARLVESSEAGVHSAGEGSPHKVTTRRMRSYSDGEEEEEEEEDGDNLSIKVKTLEEIKEEKMRKQAGLAGKGEMKGLSSIRQTLDLTDGEERKPRQVIVSEVSNGDSSLENTAEEKKIKRRPWRTQIGKPARAVDIGEDSRTAVSEESQSPPRAVGLEAKDKLEPEVEETPFEQLKRRALQKKMEKRRQALLAKSGVANDALTKQEEEETKIEVAGVGEEEDELEEKSSKSRKHQHKHKHKHSKKERQIYMPPGMKNSAVAHVHPTRQMDDGTAENSNDSTDLAAPDGGSGKRAAVKKGPHKMAAAWAAGLSLSAKGTVARRPEVKPLIASTELVPEKTSKQPSVLQRLNKPTVPMAASTGGEDSEPPGGVVIKTFSEIMAEKRKRRLELQAQKSGQKVSSAESGSPPRPETASKPRLPITPIVFDKDSPVKDSSRPFGGPISSPPRPVVPLTVQPSAPTRVAPLSFRGDAVATTTTVALPSDSGDMLQTSPSKPGTQSLNSATSKKSKKLFKKKKSVDNISPVAGSVEVSRPAEPVPANLFGGSASSHLDLEDSSLSLSLLEEEEDVGQFGSVAGHVEPVGKAATQQLPPPPVALREEVEKSAVKHRSPSIGNEIPRKKSRLSLDEELSLLEEDEESTPVLAQEESFDDLLQDIDDLLA